MRSPLELMSDGFYQSRLGGDVPYGHTDVRDMFYNGCKDVPNSMKHMNFRHSAICKTWSTDLVKYKICQHAHLRFEPIVRS